MDMRTSKSFEGKKRIISAIPATGRRCREGGPCEYLKFVNQENKMSSRKGGKSSYNRIPGIQSDCKLVPSAQAAKFRLYCASDIQVAPSGNPYYAEGVLSEWEALVAYRLARFGSSLSGPAWLQLQLKCSSEIRLLNSSATTTILNEKNSGGEFQIDADAVYNGECEKCRRSRPIATAFPTLFRKTIRHHYNII
eukprot:GHVU01013204.1.p1 GENE.GHVU01013204.1~~GHVU01013204.1.p1  ORF type:complete len:194 (+),score=7.18 GHVU01013204.1:1278-1859(+)